VDHRGRRRAAGAALLAGVVVVGLLAAPAGATTTGRTPFSDTVTADMPAIGRCVSVDVSGTLAWTVRRGALVARYSDVDAQGVELDTTLHPGCGERRGPVTGVDVVLTWPGPCEEPCVGSTHPGARKAADLAREGYDGWDDVQVHDGTGTVVPDATHRTWADATLCVTLTVRIWAQAETRLARDERNAGIIGSTVELPVEVCAT
jgi:hypothetical protein